jgi:hypothetical protein
MYHDSLTIGVRPEPGYVLITAAGEIDIFTVARLREALFTLAGDGRPLIADLDRVTFLGGLDRTLRLARTLTGAVQALPAAPDPAASARPVQLPKPAGRSTSAPDSPVPVTQDEDLGVLGAAGPGEQGKPAEYAKHC